MPIPITIGTFGIYEMLGVLHSAKEFVFREQTERMQVSWSANANHRSPLHRDLLKEEYSFQSPFGEVSLSMPEYVQVDS